MQELRVLLETKQPINDEIRSAWFLLPIDEEELQERLGVDAESEDYRILEKELPFADDVGEDTTIERLNDMYRTYESLPADLKEDYDELMGSVKKFVSLVKDGSFLVRMKDMTILIEKEYFYASNKGTNSTDYLRKQHQ